MKKVVILTLIAIFLLLSPLAAQSADMVTEMLRTDEVTWGQAAYFFACYLNDDTIPESNESAMAYLVDNDYLNKTYNVDDVINLKNFSGLCAKAFNINGGLMYTLTKADRYAFRELKALEILNSNDDPSQTLTGTSALNIITSCTIQFTSGE